MCSKSMWLLLIVHSPPSPEVQKLKKWPNGGCDTLVQCNLIGDVRSIYIDCLFLPMPPLCVRDPPLSANMRSLSFSAVRKLMCLCNDTSSLQLLESSSAPFGNDSDEIEDVLITFLPPMLAIISPPAPLFDLPVCCGVAVPCSCCCCCGVLFDGYCNSFLNAANGLCIVSMLFRVHEPSQAVNERLDRIGGV